MFSGAFDQFHCLDQLTYANKWANTDISQIYWWGIITFFRTNEQTV